MEKIPQWYWSRGLHDAVITGTKLIHTPLVIGGKHCNNCFVLYIDAAQAMFDLSVREIRFYNCSGFDTLLDCRGDWWIEDTLEKSNGKYILSLTVGNRFGNRCVSLRFVDCEVLRNPT